MKINRFFPLENMVVSDIEALSILLNISLRISGTLGNSLQWKRICSNTCASVIDLSHAI